MGYALIFDESGFIGAIQNLKVSLREYTSAVDSYIEKVEEEIENLLRYDNTNSIEALEKLGVFSNNNKNIYEYKWLKSKRKIKSNKKSWSKKMFYE